MTTSKSSVIVVLIIIAASLGYAIATTFPAQSEVESRLEQIESKVDPLDPAILESKELKELETLRVFGQRPIIANPNTGTARNPFEGL